MQALALNYVAANTDIDGIIIGVDNIQQLQSNIEAIDKSVSSELIQLIDNISTEHSELLNPVNWA